MDYRYRINCHTENGRELSNLIDEQSLKGLEALSEVIRGQNPIQYDFEPPSSWGRQIHWATAREAYGWRHLIEEIKRPDLSELCAHVKGASERRVMTDKPLMLKICGEITHALMHSYELGHSIVLDQIRS